MTIDLEARVRESLDRRAAAVAVDVPDPATARAVPWRRPGRRRHLELAAVAAALALFVAAALVVVLAGRHSSGSDAGTSPWDVPEVGELGSVVDPGALISMPSPWLLQRFNFLSAAVGEANRSPGVVRRDAEGRLVPLGPASTMVEYQFDSGGRSLQVNFYPVGERSPQVTTDAPPLVEVRGTTGWYLDYGGSRYRVQWDEGGRTWEADGTGYASLDEFVAVVDSIVWEDDAAWSVWAPAGLPPAILANPDGAVYWSRGTSPQLTVSTPSPTSRD